MRHILPVLLVGFFLMLPLLVTTAQDTYLVPCDGTAIDKDGNPAIECQVCHAVELGQRLINFFVTLAAFIAVIVFAYAGFLMLTAAGETGKISQARGMFTSVLVGLIIVLVGWLIIDTVMKWTFQGMTEEDEGSPLYEESKKWGFGPWNEVKCAILPTMVGSTEPSPYIPPPRTGGSRAGAGGFCNPNNPDCTPEKLQAQGFTEAQAKVMSCIAQSESHGFAGNVNKTPQKFPYPGYISYACGLFQILPSNWAKRELHQGNCSAATSCKDPVCNIQTARILGEQRVKRGQSRYADWTCPNCNAVVKRACVDKYDPGG